MPGENMLEKTRHNHGSSCLRNNRLCSPTSGFVIQTMLEKVRDDYSKAWRPLGLGFSRTPIFLISHIFKLTQNRRENNILCSEFEGEIKRLDLCS